MERFFDSTFSLDGLMEDVVWKQHIQAVVEDLPDVAYRCCQYAFGEMLNNAVDHSGGKTVRITVKNDGVRVSVSIEDDGIGIFRKVADALDLPETRFAILELAKGKFTTDPGSHSGEGIFFSSKVTDSFAILSDKLVFRTDKADEKTYLLDLRQPTKGTRVIFDVLFSHQETLKEVFDRFTQAPDHYGFTKTTVPVRLLEYGDNRPVFLSRSQAKRLLSRFERFESILLDFDGIDEIGQGFADELFRVFPALHPETKIDVINCAAQVTAMIRHVTDN